MTPEAKRIKEKLERKDVMVDRKELDKIVKDRLDFGFDSIYFRYAEACDELAAYMSRADHIDPVEAHHKMSNRKMHFYYALEQLLQAHVQEDK